MQVIHGRVLALYQGDELPYEVVPPVGFAGRVTEGVTEVVLGAFACRVSGIELGRRRKDSTIVSVRLAEVRLQR